MLKCLKRVKPFAFGGCRAWASARLYDAGAPDRPGSDGPLLAGVDAGPRAVLPCVSTPDGGQPAPDSHAPGPLSGRQREDALSGPDLSRDRRNIPNAYVIERLEGGGWSPLPGYRFSFAGWAVRILEGSAAEVRFDTFGGATTIGGSGAGLILLQGRHRSAEIAVRSAGAVEITER
jgi:hypothetical protein